MTWTIHDTWENAGSETSVFTVIPALLSFKGLPNSTTIESLSQLDLSLRVNYPNGTALTNTVGWVTGSYTNSTGSLQTLPLTYNDTEQAWHMYYSASDQGELTFSFSAVDNYGNQGFAPDAYHLKIIPSRQIETQRLFIAGTIGSLAPIGLLAWAIATISTRRRKHRP
jgi:hypothetical protein